MSVDNDMEPARGDAARAIGPRDALQAMWLPMRDRILDAWRSESKADHVIRDGQRYFMGFLRTGRLTAAMWGSREQATRYTRSEAYAEVERLPLPIRVLCDVEAAS